MFNFIDSPGFQNSFVENQAFNLYAMDISRLDNIVDRIAAGETSFTSSEYISPDDKCYIERQLAKRGIFATLDID